MKRIFTILISVFTISTAFAQNDNKGGDWASRGNDGHDRDGKDQYGRYDKYDKHDNRRGGYYFSDREKDMQIAQINRNYDYKIQAVQNKYFMSWREKKRQISFLQEQRNCEVNAVMDKFTDRRNRFLYPVRRYERW
ncbi:MAG TPA: hypothetical protein PLZ45_11410 [Ferruginibacter sp.]|nr:hypothetical protein [Ferruginibacter sp.]